MASPISLLRHRPVPARPAIVAVNTRYAPLIAALRNAGIQTGQAAVLTVDADRQLVHHDWASPEQSRRHFLVALVVPCNN